MSLHSQQGAPSAGITHASVLRLAVPIILSNLTVPLMGVFDTAIIGQLGSAVILGAVGLGATVVTSILWFFGFLRMATTGLAAQAHGSGDEGVVTGVLLRALLIAAVAGGLLILGQALLIPLALKIAPASAEVEELAQTYAYIRILSAPAALGVFAINGFFIATDRSAVLLFIQILISGLNVALNFWFVLGLGWGVEGVAWASVIAEVVGVTVGLGFCFWGRGALVRKSLPRLMDTGQLLKLFSISGDIFLRSLMLQIIFVSFIFLGSGFGDVELAANQVLFQFMHLIAYGLDGFAFAAEALVGQAVGRRDRAGLLRAVKLAGLWGAALSVITAAGIWFSSYWAIDMMTTSQEVRDMARIFVIYAALTPIIGFASWLLDGVFIGATRGPDMRNMMALSLIGYGIAIWVLTPNLENHGLWIAWLISYILRAATLASRFPKLLASIEK